MTATAKNKYLVTPLDSNNAPYEVEADRVEVEKQTGYINFYVGDNDLVARVLNAGFRKL